MEITIDVFDDSDGSWTILKEFKSRLIEEIDRKFLWWEWKDKVWEKESELVKQAVLEAKNMQLESHNIFGLRVRDHLMDLEGNTYNCVYWQNGKWLVPANEADYV